MNIFDPHITGSLSVSASANIQGDLIVGGTIYGTAQISGQVQEAVSASHAASYVLTSSFENYTSSVATTGSNTFVGDQTIRGSLLPQDTLTHDIGSDAQRWRDIYLAGNTINLGGTKITKNDDGDVEFKDSSDNLKKVIASEVELGRGTDKVIIRKDNNGKIKITDVDDTDGETSLSGSFTGSFVGDGSRITNVPASAVQGLSLNRIADGAVTASIGNGKMILNANFEPDLTDTRDLGSPTKQWRDLFLSSGSLYINGQQVLSTTGNELRITTDDGESIKIIETGSDTITLQTENGDITLTSSGNGNIELDAPIQIGAGNKILSSDGNSIVFGNGLIITGSIVLSGTVDGVDVASLKSDVDAILAGSSADKNSFAEIVSLINSVDTTNDQSFASFYTASNNRFTSIESTTSSFDGRIDSLETKTGSLDGQISTINSLNTTQNGRLSSLETKTGSLDSDISGLDRRLDSLEIESGSIRSTFNSYTSSNNTTNTTQNSRLSSLETKTGSLETTNTTQNSRLSSLETKTGSLDSNISTLDGRLDSIESFTSSINDTYATDEDVTRLRGDFNSHTNSVNNTLNIESLRLNSLELFTASIDDTYATDSDITTLRGELNTYTSSNNTTNNTQNSRLGSLETSRTSFNSFTSSIGTTIKDKLNNERVISGSSQVVLNDADKTGFNTTDVPEGTNLYYTDARVKSKLSSEGVISGSLQITTLPSVDTDDLSEGTTNLYFTNNRVDSRINSKNVVSGSEQIDVTRTTNYSVVGNKLSSLETTSGSHNTRLNTLESFKTTIETGIELTGSNVTIKGNLLVKGTETRVNSTTVDVSDNIISLNGTGASNAGIEVRDVTSPGILSGSLIWDGLENQWKGGTKGTEERILLERDLTTLDGRLDSLETQSGSIRTTFNSYTSSNNTTNTTQNSRLNSLESATGSYTTTDYYTTGATFDNTTGVIRGTRNDGGSWTVDIDGRYLQSHPTVVSATSSNNSGRTYIQDILLDGNGHVTGLTTATETVVNTDTIDYVSDVQLTENILRFSSVGRGFSGDIDLSQFIDNTNTFLTGATFNSSNGVVTLTKNDGTTVTVDLDGRYSESSHTHNVYDLNVFSSGQDPNTYSQSRFWSSLNGAERGNYPSSYNGIVNLGIDASHSLQFSYHYGATDDALYFRHKSDNPSAPNGVGWQNWQRVATQSWVSGRNYLTAHPSVSAATSSNNSGRTYIQDILLDSFGHITGITTSTETVVNTDTNYYVTGATFSNSTADLVLTRNDGNTVTVRLLDTLSDVTVTGGTYNSGTQTLRLIKSDGSTVDVSGFAIDTDVNWYTTGATFNASNGVITGTRNDGGTWTVDIDGRYLTSYTETDTLNSVVARGNTTSYTMTIGPTLTVQADNSANHTASRIWLKSHDDYRGAGTFMSSTDTTWYAGTPYTGFKSEYIISRVANPDDESTANPSNSLFRLNSSGNLTITGTFSASGYNKTNWDTAYGWGNHSGLYLGINSKAVDSNLLDGIDSSSFLRSNVVDATVTGTILSTNNANVDGANFEVNTTNKSVNEYAYKVSRSGGAVGGIYIDGRGEFPSLTAGGANITSTTVSNWNTAYGWGNHSGLYLGINSKATDSNLLDGIDSSSFLRSDANDTFTADYLGFSTLSLGIANNNSVNGYNTYFRGDSTHFVLGLTDGNTLYLNYGNSSGTIRTFGTWNHEGTEILSSDRTLSNVRGNISMFTNDSGYITSTASISGNAATSSKWATARTITLNGDVSGSVSIDGSANVTLSAEVANDSHTHDGRYFTETESDARYPLSRGGLGTSTTVGDTTGWGNNLAAGTYTRGYVGHGGQVIMSHDTGGSVGNVGIEVTYYGSMYVHTNVDSNQWVTKQIWTSENFTSTNISNWNTAYGWGNHANAGYTTTDYYTTGATFNSGTGIITFTRNNGATYTLNIAATLTDVTVTGGTYNSGTQTLRLTKSNGTTVDVSGFAVDTDVNWYTTSASFNTGNGIITGTRNDGGTWTVDIDGRFVPYSGGNMTGDLNWGTTGTGLTWTMNTDGAYIKFYNTGDGDTDSRLEYGTSDNGNEYHRWMISTVEEMTLKSDGLRVRDSIWMGGNLVATESWVSGRGYLTVHPTIAGVSSNNSGRTYIQDVLTDSNGHVTGLTTASETVINTDTNYYVSSAAFNTGDGVLTLSRNGLSAVTVDLDGRYQPTGTYLGAINYNNDSNSTYQMLWGSGNAVYGTAGVYLNPSTDYVYGASFNASDWFRSSGNTGWYNSTYGGGWYMADSSYIRPYNGKSLSMDNGSIDYVTQLHFNDNVRFYDEGNNQYLNFKWGNTGAGGIKFVDGDSTVQGYVYGTGTGSFGLLDSNGSWKIRVNTSEVEHYANTYVTTLYANLIYDRNNTAYFLNPAEESNLNTLTLNSTASGTTVFNIQGTQGQLFSITDDLTGDLFSVSDASGVPIFNVNANGTVSIDSLGSLVIGGNPVLTAHPSVSAATSSNNSGRTYIQDILLDSFGHITGITTATETVVNTDTNTVTSVGISGDLSTGNITLVGAGSTTVTKSGGTITITSTDTNTDTNYYTTGATFGTSTGIITFTRNDGGTYTIDIDGKYAESSHTHTPTQVGLGNVSNTAQVTVTNNSSLNGDTRNTRGVTRLYRRDDNSDYSVQTYWTGSYWFLKGYNGDTFHADVQVAYADSAGSATNATNANYATSAGSADQIDGVGFRNTGSNSGIDADTLNSNGITYYTKGVTNFSGNSGDGALYSQAYSSIWQHQIAGDYRSGQIAVRGKNNNTWQAWKKVALVNSRTFTNVTEVTFEHGLGTDNVIVQVYDGGGSLFFPSELRSAGGVVTALFVSARSGRIVVTG